MKKVLLSLLVIVIALGLLGAAGYAGYRYGFTQGIAAATSNGANGQSVRPGLGMSPRGMPMHSFGIQRGFDRDGFGMMGRSGFGFRILPLFGLLIWLLFLGLIGAGIYWLIKRSGWRLTRAVLSLPQLQQRQQWSRPLRPHPPRKTGNQITYKD